ncbi:hypothetical protein RB195_006354 [Necator americanus]|uniref:Uncharacterized protein n=1 Tax=Necator americanus TaxID=51031 RepID=A0ABR1BVN4_NECAM
MQMDQHHLRVRVEATPFDTSGGRQDQRGVGRGGQFPRYHLHLVSMTASHNPISTKRRLSSAVHRTQEGCTIGSSHLTSARFTPKRSCGGSVRWPLHSGKRVRDVLLSTSSTTTHGRLSLRPLASTEDFGWETILGLTLFSKLRPIRLPLVPRPKAFPEAKP